MISNEIKLFIDHFMIFSKQFHSKMFSLRVFFIFWLSSSIILLGKGVQGSFPFNWFGEAEEHVAHDSASWNSRDLNNLQPNIHNDNQNHMAPSTDPVSWDYSQQEPGENVDWGAYEISPVDLWNSHADQPTNLQEVMSFNQGHPGNFAPFEDSSIYGQHHQKEAYPHAGSSQYQSSSSRIIPSMHSGDHDQNYVNSVPNFDEFRYPLGSSAPQPHQNLEISHDNQMTQDPAFHFAQGYFWNDPRLSEMSSNSGYQNHDRSSHHSGSTNAGAEIDHWGYSIDNESLNVATSNNLIGESTSSYYEVDYDSLDVKLKLIQTLKENFTKCSKQEVISRVTQIIPEGKTNYLRSIHERALNFIMKHISEVGPQVALGVEEPYDDIKTVTRANQKKHFIIEYTLAIEWTGHKSLKSKISEFVDNFITNNKDTIQLSLNSDGMELISLLGVTFMKIIAKNYPKTDVSKEFEDDDSLLHYTKAFWEFCFMDHGNIEEKLQKFFRTIGGPSRFDNTIDKYLITKLSRNGNTPVKIFPQVADKLKKNASQIEIYTYSWYFVFLRAMVYYPELIYIPNHLSGNQLKYFIEDGIMYYFEEGEEVLLLTKK
ncbi:expressed protein, partial [Phakopsora pachyrhizi]